MNISRYVLLTGAGFTKNFGAFLAKEICSELFNNFQRQSSDRLKELPLNDSDYESIYHQVINGDYSDKEKTSINMAIFDVYHKIDKIVAEWTGRKDGANPVNIYGVNKFIERFSGQRPDTVGFFFTLNQDLFIERYFNSGMEGLDTLGVRKIPNNENINLKLPIERGKDFITLPTENELNKIIDEKLSSRMIYYVKLHGSYGWLSSNGVNSYVIGKNKEDQLSQEPLLSYYFDKFKKILSMPDRKLFIIGYSFRDNHINNIIADAVSNSGLKIYVISPLALQEFSNDLRSAEHGLTILKALKGYYPNSLLDIFPPDQSETHIWREILTNYFKN